MTLARPSTACRATDFAVAIRGPTDALKQLAPSVRVGVSVAQARVSRHVGEPDLGYLLHVSSKCLHAAPLSLALHCHHQRAPVASPIEPPKNTRPQPPLITRTAPPSARTCSIRVAPTASITVRHVACRGQRDASRAAQPCVRAAVGRAERVAQEQSRRADLDASKPHPLRPRARDVLPAPAVCSVADMGPRIPSSTSWPRVRHASVCIDLFARLSI